MASYNPNLKDPRVLKRIAEVLQWVRLMLTPLGGIALHKTTLDAVFGPSGNPLSKFLREKLLVMTAQYLVGETAKSYALNIAGYKSLLEMLDNTDFYSTYYAHARRHNALVKRHAAELETLTFTYTESSDRHWHPLQNIRRDAKHEFWSEFGLPYDYDIEACAPTVLMHLALKFGLPKIVLDGLDDFITNKSEFREHVAKVAGLSVQDAKKLINSLFNGARLVPHHACSAYVLVGYDRERLQKLKDDARIRRLRSGVRHVWQRLGLQMNKSFAKGSDKWSLYFAWERQVMDVVRDLLVKNKVKFFTEHDGFRTHREIDASALEQQIEAKTGLRLRIKHG